MTIYSEQGNTFPIIEAFYETVKSRIQATESKGAAALWLGKAAIMSVPLTLFAFTISSAAALYHIGSYPLTLRDWSIEGAKAHVNAALKEITTLFIGILASPLVMGNSSYGEKEGEPILLIHGGLGNSSTWLYHINELKKAGLGPIYTVDYSPLQSENAMVALLDKRVEEITKAHNGKKVHLIAHSLGGYLASLLATKDAETRVISVATLGSPIQDRDSIGPLSAAIEKKTDIKFLHITTINDLLIKPERGHPEASGEHIQKVTMQGIGHIGFIHSGTASEMVIHHYKTCISSK